MKRRIHYVLLALLIAGCTPSEEVESPQDGKTVWADISGGQLKARVFESEDAGPDPILVIVLHGDLLGPQAIDPYHHQFARRVISKASNVVAAGLLRPGYSDATGDRSDGEPFLATGDNYTAAVVDAIADTTEHLRSLYRPRAVVAVGHSGGAAIAALLLGHRPGIADAAVLVACPCDLPAWREHMMAERPNPVWRQPIDGLSPLDFATDVLPSVTVELIAGKNDRVALPEYSEAYATALGLRGVDVRSLILPEREHDILLDPAVLGRTLEVLKQL